MYKLAVHAYGYYIDTKFLKLTILIGDRRYLGRSDKGEITGVKA